VLGESAVAVDAVLLEVFFVELVDGGHPGDGQVVRRWRFTADV
jgi:hypothetical protein